MKKFKKIISGLFIWSLISTLSGIFACPEEDLIIQSILIGHIVIGCFIPVLWVLGKSLDCIMGD